MEIPSPIPVQFSIYILIFIKISWLIYLFFLLLSLYITLFILHQNTNSLLVLPLEQKRLTLPEHLISTMVFSGVCVSRSSIFHVMFCLIVSCPVVFFLCHCVVCSLINVFRLPLWYLEALLSCTDHLYSYYSCGRSVYIDDVGIFILYMIYTSLHDVVYM